MPANATGRRQTNRLTDLQVKRAKPGKHYDGDGLFLVVDKSGARRWVQRLYVRGLRKDIGIGGANYTDLVKARAIARENRAVARQDGAPVLERREKAQAQRLAELGAGGRPSFEAVAVECHEHQERGWKNEKHKAQWLSTLRAYAFPTIGAKRVDQITLADVTAVLRPIWTSKHATALRVRQRIGLVLDYAKSKEWRAGENPIREIPKGTLGKTTRVKRHHPALPFNEVPAFLERLRLSNSTAAARSAFEVLILTAARTTEVLASEWPEFDLDAGIWTIPADRMKNGLPHEVPLTRHLVAILRLRRQAHSGRGEFVFESKPGRRLSQMALLEIMRRMKVPYVVHGFRSSFRDFASEKTDAPREVAEAALAHTVRDKTEAAYFRSTLLAKRRTLMERWTEFCVGECVGEACCERLKGSRTPFGSACTSVPAIAALM